ncbi:MAG: ribosome silencing factor [Hyphomonadaceae bacterium]|nr:ribosome silencing factor [Hyphomonadaceae bacterium]
MRDTLDQHSAQDTVTIDVRGKSSIADYMVVTSGRSSRHVETLAEYVRRALKENGYKNPGMEGRDSGDWILIDAGDVILHIFRPEVRVFYNLEKIWSVPLPEALQEGAATASA